MSSRIARIVVLGAVMVGSLDIGCGESDSSPESDSKSESNRSSDARTASDSDSTSLPPLDKNAPFCGTGSIQCPQMACAANAKCLGQIACGCQSGYQMQSCDRIPCTGDGRCNGTGHFCAKVASSSGAGGTGSTSSSNSGSTSSSTSDNKVKQLDCIVNCETTWQSCDSFCDPFGDADYGECVDNCTEKQDSCERGCRQRYPT